MEKLLLEQDDLLFTDLMRDIKQYDAPGQALVSAYNALSMGDFNNEVFEEMKESGLSNILSRYREQVDKDVKKLGLKWEVLQKNFYETAEVPVPALKRAWEEFKRFTPTIYAQRTLYITIEYLTYEGGKFVVNEENQERVKEAYCRQYLQPGKETELYDLLTGFIEPYLAFCKTVKELQLDLRTGFSMASLNQFYKGLGDPDMRVNPDMLKGAIQFKHRRR